MCWTSSLAASLSSIFQSSRHLKPHQQALPMCLCHNIVHAEMQMSVIMQGLICCLVCVSLRSSAEYCALLLSLSMGRLDSCFKSCDGQALCWRHLCRHTSWNPDHSSCHTGLKMLVLMKANFTMERLQSHSCFVFACRVNLIPVDSW